MVVRLNKLIVSLSVGSVLGTGRLGCGHARPVNFINHEVGQALLWLTYDCIEYCLDHLRRGLPHLISGTWREVTLKGAQELAPWEAEVSREGICNGIRVAHKVVMTRDVGQVSGAEWGQGLGRPV